MAKKSDKKRKKKKDKNLAESVEPVEKAPADSGQSEPIGTAVRVISKADYPRILLEWNESGPGQVLLFNIELQSFENAEQIESTWGGIAKLQNIQNVILVLPKSKVRRWEKVVLREFQSGRFFENPANRKFLVCESPENIFALQKDVGTVQEAPRFGLALYRLGTGQGEWHWHDDVLIFMLCEPFSKLRKPFVAGDQPWWDYKRILLTQPNVIVDNPVVTLKQAVDGEYLRDVERVREDVKPLEPTAPETFLTRLNVGESRKRELLERLVDRKPVREAARPARVPRDRAEDTFRIPYDNGDRIEGRFAGVSKDEGERREGIVWVGGFTEKKRTELEELFRFALRREAVVQFYYQVSGPCEDVNLSYFQQDMREVLTYVNEQEDIVRRNKIILIARSINAFVGALVASEPEYLRMLKSVILVSPVFDVIEMMDGYRSLRKKPEVRIENALRYRPHFDDGDRWDNRVDTNDNWLEFFGHNLSLTVLADIARHRRDHYSFRAFKRAIGEISQEVPVYLLANQDDPVTKSERAIRSLQDAASGGGYIDRKNFSYIPIDSHHLPPGQFDQDAYPFVIKAESKEVRKILVRLEIHEENGATPT